MRSLAWKINLFVCVPPRCCWLSTQLWWQENSHFLIECCQSITLHLEVCVTATGSNGIQASYYWILYRWEGAECGFCFFFSLSTVVIELIPFCHQRNVLCRETSRAGSVNENHSPVGIVTFEIKDQRWRWITNLVWEFNPLFFMRVTQLSREELLRCLALTSQAARQVWEHWVP